MPDFVVDVGNTRMKWGQCGEHQLTRTVALPLGDELEWQRQIDAWNIPSGSYWVLAGTHPGYRNLLAGWLQRRGDTVRVIDDYRQLPLQVLVDSPERVGIDRLLNAVAVRSLAMSGTPIVMVDAGSAVTVDLVDGNGAFRGGAIFPGFRLMAKALNAYTAKLPLIEDIPANPNLPGTNTVAAMEAGIANVILGGVERIIASYTAQFGAPRVFLAGGDAEKLVSLSCQPVMVGPSLTLEGIRIAALEGSKKT